jgi:hypothetical protein
MVWKTRWQVCLTFPPCGHMVLYMVDGVENPKWYHVPYGDVMVPYGIIWCMVLTYLVRAGPGLRWCGLRNSTRQWQIFLKK